MLRRTCLISMGSVISHGPSKRVSTFAVRGVAGRRAAECSVARGCGASWSGAPCCGALCRVEPCLISMGSVISHGPSKGFRRLRCEALPCCAMRRIAKRRDAWRREARRCGVGRRGASRSEALCSDTKRCVGVHKGPSIFPGLEKNNRPERCRSSYSPTKRSMPFVVSGVK